MKNWIKIDDRKPEDGQHIIAMFKHGIIDCIWSEEDQEGKTYVWQDVQFFVSYWIPMETFNKWADGIETE